MSYRLTSAPTGIRATGTRATDSKLLKNNDQENQKGVEYIQANGGKSVYVYHIPVDEQYVFFTETHHSNCSS